jgi:hypothetical protein
VAILDLLRIRRRDEEDEDEGVEGAEDTDEETEEETAGGSLLGRLSMVSSLGRVIWRSGGYESEDGDAAETEDGESAGGLLSRFKLFRRLGEVLRRGSDDEDEGEEDDGDGDAEGDEYKTEDGESAGGLLNRLMVVCRLGGILRRGSSDDEDEDEDEDDASYLAAAVLTPGPQLQTTDGPEAVGPETEGPVDTTGLQERTSDSPSTQTYQLATDVEEAPENGEKSLEPETPGTQVELPPVVMRLRELAQSQEDVPVEELADDLRNLLNLLSSRRR